MILNIWKQKQNDFSFTKKNYDIFAFEFGKQNRINFTKQNTRTRS